MSPVEAPYIIYCLTCVSVRHCRSSPITTHPEARFIESRILSQTYKNVQKARIPDASRQ